ncbi:hypothetical protein BDW22DRAFT_612626 [Trametopsis cervina]|nr:hypothetical protein BDW22DRAFT_612626 [Trametopsis cervina]
MRRRRVWKCRCCRFMGRFRVSRFSVFSYQTGRGYQYSIGCRGQHVEFDLSLYVRKPEHNHRDLACACATRHNAGVSGSLCFMVYSSNHCAS